MTPPGAASPDRAGTRDSPVLTGLLLGDEQTVWERLGFRIDDRRLTLAGVTIELRGDGGVPLLALEPRIDEVLDGLAMHARATPVPVVEHPNRITAVDHVSVETGDLDRTVSALAHLGIMPRRRAQNLRRGEDRRYAFYVLRTCVLEVVGPQTAVDARPARVTGVAFTARDLDHLGPGASLPRDAVQKGRRIAVLDTAAVGSTIRMAVLTPR